MLKFLLKCRILQSFFALPCWSRVISHIASFSAKPIINHCNSKASKFLMKLKGAILVLAQRLQYSAYTLETVTNLELTINSKTSIKSLFRVLLCNEHTASNNTLIKRDLASQVQMIFVFRTTYSGSVIQSIHCH